MKLRTFTIALLAIMLTLPCTAQKAKEASKTNKGKGAKVEFVNKEAERKVDIMIGGKLFTSYTWPTNVYKPVLYPVYTANGTEITRGFPLRPRAGERNDHIHQVGIWLNYGNVNGLDFWGNGSTGKKNPKGGEVIHLSVDQMKGGNGEGVMITKESWIDPSGKELLSEKSEYHFIAQGSLRIVDRLTTLTSTGGEVKFADTKEGMFGIRVARQLELPSKDKGVLIDAQGNPSEKRASSNEGATGNYRSSEGVTGEAVWSTRAKWMNLFGSIGNEKISIVVCDHPRNVSYPTYWHARGYGLFSANPLGVKDFTQGKEELNLTLQNGQSTTFRYRVIVNTGADLTDAQINKLCDEFAQKYK